MALLVEMGGLGPFVTMSLANVPQAAKVQPKVLAAPRRPTTSSTKR